MDYKIFTFINNLAGQNAILDKIGAFLAVYFFYVIIAGALAFGIYWIFKNKSWKVLWQLVASAILSRLIIAEFLKRALNRPRPFLTHSVNLLIARDTDGSFPSGHTTLLFPLAAIIYFYNKKLGWLFFILSFISCFARIFAGVHYPSDILGGIIIGIASGWLVYRFTKKS